MFDLVEFLQQLQWYVAVLFVPLAVCVHCSKLTAFWRWVALLSGYSVQVGLFLLLDDTEFKTSTLLFVTAAATYFWIAVMADITPTFKFSLSRARRVEPAP